MTHDHECNDCGLEFTSTRMYPICPDCGSDWITTDEPPSEKKGRVEEERNRKIDWNNDRD